MICPYCAEVIEDGCAFCSKCGTQMGTPIPPPAILPGDLLPNREPENSGKALGSLISGLFFFIWPASIAAIILGHISLGEIRQSAGRLKGRGMAIAGLVLGYIGVSILPLLIIAAIAIPNLLRARVSANEASAVGALKSYSFALGTYASNCPKIGFPRSLENLGPGREHCEHEGLLDGMLGRAHPRRSGYRFEYSPGAPDDLGQITSFTLIAEPLPQGGTGLRHFFVDQTGVIRVSNSGTAYADSPPLEPASNVLRSR